MTRIDLIVRDICELPDRTSPEDQPDMLLVTEEELRIILARHEAFQTFDKTFNDLSKGIVK